MSLANPVNLLLLPPILWLLYRAVWPSYPSTPKTQPTKYDGDAYNWAPGSHPEVVTSKAYSTAELSQFDGRKSKRILLAIAKIDGGRVLERTVFDVSAGSNFYGPDGMYGNFAGRDASRGMAKQSFDEEMLTDIDKPLDTLADLTASEIDNMHGWHGHFTNKYTVVGVLE
ncbi:Dihydrodipicolinate synthase [Vanrija albida]|uniref:Dihydrodipicolinate synthase n=1 Tax=Vanrija albida TaxID=181172 RepID=A0ABR3PRA1_9TREE